VLLSGYESSVHQARHDRYGVEGQAYVEVVVVVQAFQALCGGVVSEGFLRASQIVLYDSFGSVV
jgi:hypothetical protein